MQQVKLPSTWQAIQEAGQKLLGEVARQGYDESFVFSIRLALEEGLINAVKHGNGMDSSKHIDLKYSITPERVEIIITDEGCGFCPVGVPDPTCAENLEKTTGRGIMLMRAFMDTVEYSKRGSELRLVKLSP